jgi:hypothetical protein
VLNLIPWLLYSANPRLQLLSLRNAKKLDFFPVGDACPPCGEQVPAPETDEVVVFRDFFTYGLRFPCDPALPSILDKFLVKMHQLTPKSFLEVSKFF